MDPPMCYYPNEGYDGNIGECDIYGNKGFATFNPIYEDSLFSSSTPWLDAPMISDELSFPYNTFNYSVSNVNDDASSRSQNYHPNSHDMIKQREKNDQQAIGYDGNEEEWGINGNNSYGIDYQDPKHNLENMISTLWLDDPMMFYKENESIDVNSLEAEKRPVHLKLDQVTTNRILPSRATNSNKKRLQVKKNTKPKPKCRNTSFLKNVVKFLEEYKKKSNK
ncbi:hypothetical protein OWV82_010563 [Melia azedarach]|uniref:Uncharacterized protein n=1 Tax=Melia azedarach TaxID=155640 RepID=A0ACC1Y6S3_MELAZ|nr:hypothetical protein OWV82_010563 [Melia azedarach]